MPVPKFRVLNELPTIIKNYQEGDGRRQLQCPATGPYRLSEFIASAKKQELESGDLTPEIQEKLRRYFVIDAFLSNADLHAGNIIINLEDTPVRIDNGAALRFSAKGLVKEEGKGSPIWEERGKGAVNKKTGNFIWSRGRVLELLTLPESQGPTYGNISLEEIRRQIEELLGKSDVIMSTIDRVSSELKMKVSDVNQKNQCWQVAFKI